ncbi:hypothetical protein NDU88_001329 [Pleurodeles waltl]|uniref:Uncharacterized protein n=1 Tax=Pleurodeles waltl TaxID=8319 RepID=A0AAV7S793_PLEWA|nr:hypothetical protein NDU88_001329 [Pleurodeles waltl]
MVKPRREMTAGLVVMAKGGRVTVQNNRCSEERHSDAVAKWIGKENSCLPAAMSAFNEKRRGRGRACVQAAAGDRPVSGGRASEEYAPEVGGGLGRNLPATVTQSRNAQYRQGNVPDTKR